MTIEASFIDRRAFLRRLCCAAPVLYSGAGVAAARTAPQSPTVDLRFIAQHLPLRRRHEWTVIAPAPSRLRAANLNTYNRITLHHTGEVMRGTTEGAAVNCLDGILNHHLRLRFGDVGYHFLIDPAGRVWEGRSLAYWGAHVSGQNEHNIGIALLGNFEQQRPPRSQLQAMQHLVQLMRRRYQIAGGQIFGHIDLGQTLCPGRNLYPRVQQLNQQVA